MPVIELAIPFLPKRKISIAFLIIQAQTIFIFLLFETALLLAQNQNNTRHAGASNGAPGDASIFAASPRDVTPPIISNVTISNRTATAVTIKWTTNELCDAQVEYGFTSRYGFATAINRAPAFSHVMMISGLQPNMTYHFRVKSKDPTGNSIGSRDFAFATLAVNFADDFNTGTLDSAKWRKGTNPANYSAVINSALVLQSGDGESGWVVTRNAYPSRNTIVSVKVARPNDDGNLGMSPTYNASAIDGIYSQPNWYRFFTYRNDFTRNLQLYVKWKKNGIENGLDVTGNLTIAGAVYLRLRSDNTHIHFEASFDGVAWTDTYTEAFSLPGYTLDSGFYYELAAYNTDHTGVLVLDDFSIATIAPDTQAPQISQMQTQNLTNNSARILWQTDELADSQVEYGLTANYGATTPLNPRFVAAHGVSLDGLLADTTYHFRAKSKDTAGNLAVSADFTFKTSRPEVRGNVAFANVQDIFDRNCTRCHSGSAAPVGLVLTSGQAYANVVNVASVEYPTWKRVAPRNRAVSWLYEKITNPSPAVGSKMENLTPDEIELIGRWIDQGATTKPSPPYADLEFRTTVLPPAEINITYNVALVVWGGLPPYRFNVVVGDLPSGLNLNGTTGYITGGPDIPGSYSFTVGVHDSRSPGATLEQTYSIDVRNTQEHWQLPPNFQIQPVVTDLDLPVNIAFAPNPGPNPSDPYFYATLLYGGIVMVQRDFQKVAYATGLLNFDPRTEPGFEELGVVGITVEPITGDVFAGMAYDSLGLKYGKVVRFHSTDGGRTAATQTAILSGIPISSSHQIHSLTIGPDGKLYLNSGDGFNPQLAQEVNDPRGKILRMNLDGTIPDDNPFPGSFTYALGFRNPFGAAWRPADNTLYVSDNGQNSDDRLAKVTRGGNYGWPKGLTQGAVHLWNPTVAPVGMDFLRDTPFSPSYSGQLFVGLSQPTYLQGPSEHGKKIQTFELDGNGKVVNTSIFLDYIGLGYATVIGVAFGPDGLYFTDLYGEDGFDDYGFTRGNVYRIRWFPPSPGTTPPAISNVKNYPNPFNASTRIHFELPQESEVQLSVYDLAGRAVLDLLSGSFSAGSHETIWDGRNRDGKELSSGIYLLRLRYRHGKANPWAQTVRRVVMVK